NHLIENEAERHQMRKRAYEYGRQMIWPEVGRGYLDLFSRAAALFHPKQLSRPRILASTQYDLPEICLDHLCYLTDDTGVVQHAPYGIPDRQSGYTTDDVARALVVALLYQQQFADKASLKLATCYLSFLKYAQLPSGHFRNCMSYTREFLDE